MGNLCSTSALAEPGVSRCWDCIAGQANYTWKLEENLIALSAALQELRSLNLDVERRVELEERQGRMVLDQVQLWLSKAQTMVAEAEELIKDGPQEVQKLCFAGYFSKNCRSSYKFGQQVAAKLEQIVDLKGKGVFAEVAFNQPVPSIRPEPTVDLESTLFKIWSLLEGTEVGIIGLYGTGGIGKTTILKQINNRVETFGYDLVIWVYVSHDPSVEKVQKQIGERIGLSSEYSWENKDFEEKALDIFTVLARKKFVLLLDDLWKLLDLIKIGIPLPTQENGSKVVFTTRSLEVCKLMKAQKTIKVECLAMDQAWKLLQEKVGEETLNSHPLIRMLAKEVAAECGGLPLALITIGRAMAYKKSPHEWRYALEVLRRSPHKFASLGEGPFPLLKFSYDSLPSNSVRSCFLYCSLYPEDYPISKATLIDYWFCEGLLNEFDSISSARMQGYCIIGVLVNACLLNEDGEKFVKMHDVIRDMALWIAYQYEASEKRFFVRAGVGLEAVPEVETWKGVRRISLMQNGIKELSSTPTCPTLQTLFLNKNDLQVIGDDFFQFMSTLRVLNLSDNKGLRKLPKGISKLVSLELLDLSRTGITELPIELKSSKNLKHLNLSSMLNLKRIPRRLISSFPSLRVFRMVLCVAYYSDEMEEDNLLQKDGNEGLLEELGCLHHLNLLSIEVKSNSALERLLSIQTIRGCTEELILRDFRESKSLNVLVLANVERLESLDVYECDCLQEMMVLKSIEREQEGRFSTNIRRFLTLSAVSIYRCPKLRDMTWLIFAPHLQSLSVGYCANMEEIMSEGKLGECADMLESQYLAPFAKLQTLRLEELPLLRSIYRGAIPFPCLREITIIRCPELQISNHQNEEWWKELRWTDETTQNAFLPSFKPLQ